MDIVDEVVFIDELLGDVGQLEVDVLQSVEVLFEVEVFDAKGDKLCVFPRENAVNAVNRNPAIRSVGQNLNKKNKKT